MPGDPSRASAFPVVVLSGAMEKQGLLFIPDISGFTRFVAQVEIEHSRQIIQELLETLIDANDIGLEISEIEGDAILFYRFGERPELNAIYAQVERMFRDFHRHLRTYEYHRLCQCKACISAVDLSLKVITHYGEFTGYNIRNFSKLIGKDVIIAHQLLKNGIEEHEYWLVTPGVLPAGTPAPLTSWMRWDASAQTTEAGETKFHYTQLGALKSDIEATPLAQLEPADKVKVVSVSREFDADVKMLFYTAGHLEFRNRWQDGLKAIEDIGDVLHSIGTRHRRVMDDGTSTMMVTSSFDFDPGNRIVYSETDEDKVRSMYFVMENLGENRSRLTLDHYVSHEHLVRSPMSAAETASIEQRYRNSLENLEALLSAVEPPPDF